MDGAVLEMTQMRHKIQANKAGAGNGAVPLVFHIEGLDRAVPDPRRYAA